MSINANVISEILQADSDDLNRIVEAVKSRRDALGRQTKFQLSIGDRVTFKTKKRGRGRVIGTIEKINRKNLVVLEDGEGFRRGVQWTVPPILVTKA